MKAFTVSVLLTREEVNHTNIQVMMTMLACMRILEKIGHAEQNKCCSRQPSLTQVWPLAMFHIEVITDWAITREGHIENLVVGVQ